jgi:hypothetical protein
LFRFRGCLYFVNKLLKLLLKIEKL